MVKPTLKSIGFGKAKEPRQCENCKFEEDHGMHGFNWVCVHPIAGKLTESKCRFHTVCKYHVFRKKSL